MNISEKSIVAKAVTIAHVFLGEPIVELTEKHAQTLEDMLNEWRSTEWGTNAIAAFVDDRDNLPMLMAMRLVFSLNDRELSFLDLGDMYLTSNRQAFNQLA